MVVRSVSTVRRGALSIEDGETIRAAAASALAFRIPLVMVLASSGADVSDGVASLHGWGSAARALTACSGMVPVVVVVTGPALSGPALLLGLADLVVMTTDAFAFVSGPAMVEEFTGVRIGIHQLGGTAMHARSSGLCAIEAATEEDAMAHVDHLLEPAARPTPTSWHRSVRAGRRRSASGRGPARRSSRPGPPAPTTCAGWPPRWPTTGR